MCLICLARHFSWDLCKIRFAADSVIQFSVGRRMNLVTVYRKGKQQRQSKGQSSVGLGKRGGPSISTKGPSLVVSCRERGSWLSGTSISCQLASLSWHCSTLSARKSSSSYRITAIGICFTVLVILAVLDLENDNLRHPVVKHKSLAIAAILNRKRSARHLILVPSDKLRPRASVSSYFISTIVTATGRTERDPSHRVGECQ